MLMTSQLKVGTAFMYEGNPLIVQKMLGQRSGRAGMVTNLRVQNLVTKSTMDLGIDAGEKFDEVDLESHVTKLSYIDGETYVFRKLTNSLNFQKRILETMLVTSHQKMILKLNLLSMKENQLVSICQFR